MIQVLPEIIFAFLVLVFLIAFLWIIKILFYTEGVNLDKKKKNIVFLIIVFFIIAVPYLVSLFLQKGEKMKPLEIFKIEIPAFLSNIPPELSFVEIEDYFFSGPWPIDKLYRESSTGAWIVFCENDIIGTGFFYSAKPNFSREEKNCFLADCPEPYYIILPIFTEEQVTETEKLFDYLVNKFNPQCNLYE